MKSQDIFLFVALFFFLFSACKEEPVIPDPSPKHLMLAVIHLPNQVPADFTAAGITGDYKSATTLLRVQGTSENSADKIELTIKNTGQNVVGTYPIGVFGQAASNGRAEYISSNSDWSARSTSGTFTVTKFELVEGTGNYLLSGTFAFKGDATVGEVELTLGEIENALLIGE